MFEIIFASIFSLLFIFAVTVVFGAPWIPTFPKAVEIILKLSKAKKGEKVVDLGSGDGRIMIAFAKQGIEVHGWEINPIMVIWSWIAIRKSGTQKLAHVHFGNFWTANLAKFDVVVVYGVSGIMKRLEKKLKRQLRPKAKVIAAIFPFVGWKEETVEKGMFLYEV